MVLLVVFALVLAFSRKAPVISSLNPAMARPGDVITLSGEYFGPTSRDGEVVLGGRIPTTGSIKSWSDNKIEIIVPEDTASGIVFVRTGQGQSGGVLFTNMTEMPTVLTSPVTAGAPFVFSLQPAQVQPGQVLTIQGRSFGDAQADSRVLLTAAASGGASPETAAGRNFVLDSDAIELWTDQELRLRLPNGTASGPLQVRTRRGLSNLMTLQVDPANGARTYQPPRHLSLTLTVDLTVGAAAVGSWLNLWWPLPASDGFQKVLQVDNAGFNLQTGFLPALGYQRVDNLTANAHLSFSQKLEVELLASDLAVNSDRLDSLSDPTSPVLAPFLASDGLIDLTDQRLINKADYIGGDDANPYVKAYRIYTYLLDLLDPETPAAETEPAKSLDSHKASPRNYALLFTAFARLAGIPARPVSGALIFDDRSLQPHIWAEFFVEGLGWVPVDPSLGDGLAQDRFPAGRDIRKLYFGNSDGAHLALAHGLPQPRPLESGGLVKGYSPPWTLPFNNVELVGAVNLQTVQWTLTGRTP